MKWGCVHRLDKMKYVDTTFLHSRSLKLLQPETVTGVLNVGGIGGARRRDGVDSVTDGASANVGGQDKGRAAALAKGSKATSGDRPLPQGAAVGLRHKFYKFFPLGKRSASSVSLCAATSTSSHIEDSFLSKWLCLGFDNHSKPFRIIP